MKQDIINLYDEYTHAPLERRVFLERLARLAGGTAAAAALLPLLEPGYARAATVPPNDPRLTIERIVYPAPAGEIAALSARSADASGPLPAVIVIHENRGLTPHIEDVVRRMAVEGFLALGPDFLSPLGGTPENPDQAREMTGQLDAAATVANAVAAVDFLKAHDATNGRVGAIGFCWGGGLVGDLAVAAPNLDAGVVFYGTAPAPESVGSIEAPLLLHYAGLDERVNASVPPFEAALQAAGKPYTLHMYEGANHAFHNDTSGERYDPEAAALAWQRTVAFLKEQLSA